MQVFRHLVYEYQKGLRDLCLHTCSIELAQNVKNSLTTRKINYHIIPIENKKINVFFGMPECIEIVKQFSSVNLAELSAEEDFILGMMLGYCKSQQYTRFLKRKLVCA